MKRTIYLKDAEIKRLMEKGETRHIERGLDLVIAKMPILEDDTV